MTLDTSQIVFLKSNNVALRPLVKDDVPLLIKWINDPEVIQYLNVYMPTMEAAEYEWFDNLHKQKQKNVVLAIVVDGKTIGTTGIHGIDGKNRRASTGALIGEKEYWGKGYGSEAKMLMLHFAFNILNLRKIYSEVFVFNERSHKYLMKCGYEEEGRRKEDYFYNGKYWDTILLAVFRDKWLPMWKIFAKEHSITTTN